MLHRTSRISLARHRYMFCTLVGLHVGSDIFLLLSILCDLVFTSIFIQALIHTFIVTDCITLFYLQQLFLLTFYWAHSNCTGWTG
jgi:hypothetical protein